MGYSRQTPSMHGVEGRLRGSQPANEPCLSILKENRLAERRSPTGTGKVIGFENPEENNKWQMPVGVGRQNDRWSDRKAERR